MVSHTPNLALRVEKMYKNGGRASIDRVIEDIRQHGTPRKLHADDVRWRQIFHKRFCSSESRTDGFAQIELTIMRSVINYPQENIR